MIKTDIRKIFNAITIPCHVTVTMVDSTKYQITCYADKFILLSSYSDSEYDNIDDLIQAILSYHDEDDLQHIDIKPHRNPEV